MEREGEKEERTTITVSRPIKDRFLERIIGAPKKFENADEAMTALMDCYETKDNEPKKDTIKEECGGNGVRSN